MPNFFDVKPFIEKIAQDACNLAIKLRDATIFILDKSR